MTWHLYVLRYKYSGNYYVGITPNLTKRMNIHFRRTSENPKRLPQWSRVNRSIQGFKCYWFELLNSHGNTHSSASLVENEVGAIIERKLNSFQNQNIQFYVNWGNKKKSQFPNVIPFNPGILPNNPMVKEIDDFILKLHLDGRIPIQYLDDHDY